MSYTKEDITELEKKAEEAEINADARDRNCYHKDFYSNSARTEVFRLKKLINLIKVIEESDTLEQVDWDKGGGLVIINKKFIVSLAKDQWRVLGKNTWYRHKQDLKHFIDKYVRKTQ
jgi:hypothetical protein